MLVVCLIHLQSTESTDMLSQQTEASSGALQTACLQFLTVTKKFDIFV